MMVWVLMAPQLPAQANNGLFKSLSLTPPTPTLIPSPTPTPVAMPLTLVVPKLNISASIQQVGTDSDGRMDVPTNFEDVGWYRFGPKPGEKGSAVIAGHLDRATGAPAVFYFLSKLEIGDQIFVIDQVGITHEFKVVNKESYDFTQVPIDSVFNSTDKSRLNLITCGGSWNFSQHNYSHRTVIYTSLVK